MKEFGLYTFSQKYIDDFGVVDPSLDGLKPGRRPCICVKLGKNNWLVPLASINPNSSDYKSKENKYKKYVALDKSEKVRAINIFDDLTGLSNNPNFSSVVEYYNAIPVQHKYCSKFFDKNNQHILINGSNFKRYIKANLIKYLNEVKCGRLAGFIKAKVEQGDERYRGYPKDILALRYALYEKATEQAEKHKNAEREHAERDASLSHKKELKRKFKKGAGDVADAHGGGSSAMPTATDTSEKKSDKGELPYPGYCDGEKRVISFDTSGEVMNMNKINELHAAEDARQNNQSFHEAGTEHLSTTLKKRDDVPKAPTTQKPPKGK
jgi:hypothetical protein